MNNLQTALERLGAFTPKRVLILMGIQMTLSSKIQGMLLAVEVLTCCTVASASGHSMASSSGDRHTCADSAVVCDCCTAAVYLQKGSTICNRCLELLFCRTLPPEGVNHLGLSTQVHVQESGVCVQSVEVRGDDARTETYSDTMPALTISCAFKKV